MRVFAALLLLLIGSTGAQAQFLGASRTAGATWTTCPYDDCTSAAGTVSNPTMFATQNKSGQTYATGIGLCNALDCHPPWPVIGVDVPNGALTATGSMHDPATTYTVSCSYPTDGVNYCATGNSINNGPRILVKTTTAPLTVSRFNLSAIGGHGCTQVQVSNASAYPITFDDWFFENDATCSNLATGTLTALFALSNYPIAVDVTWSHATAIGHGTIGDCCSIPHTGTSNISNAQFSLVSFSASTANEIIKYVNVIDWPGRILGLGGLNNTTLKTQSVTLFANYFGGMNTRCPQGHGEYYSLQYVGTLTESYDVYPIPTTSTCMSGIIFLAGSAQNIDNVDFGYNVMMGNRIGGSHVDTESVTISDVTNGVVTVSSGGANLASNTFSTASGNTMTFASLVSPGVWQSDCGVNGATGIYLQMCPCSTDGSHGCYVNASGNYHSPATFNLGYYIGNSLWSPGHAVMQNVSIHNNYMAGTGTNAGAIFVATGSCANPAVFSGNVNMETGAAQDFWTGGAGATGC